GSAAPVHRYGLGRYTIPPRSPSAASPMFGLLRLALLLALLAPAALAQVEDDFSDGDFTNDPPWTGETDRFTVVPFGADFSLRSDGIAANDTIYLATASEAAFGRWAFTFRYEANLTTANG